MTNYTWYLKTDLSKFAGKWIAIVEEKVVAAAVDLKQLTKEVSQRFLLEKVSFVKIPEKGKALVY